MKKIVFLFILLLAGWLYYNRLHSEKPVLRVGSECDYAPNNWEEKRPSDSNFPLVNNEGFYGEGYDLQIAKLVAEELGMKLEVKKIAWNDLLPALNRGEIDAVFSGMLDTEERKKIAAFSDTYEVKKTEYAVIINGSPRVRAQSNTEKIIKSFADGFCEGGNTCDTYAVSERKSWDEIKVDIIEEVNNCRKG